MPVLLILCFFARRDDLYGHIHVGQVGNLRPIGNRPYNFLPQPRRITNPPQVANLPHMIRINLRPSRAVLHPGLVESIQVRTERFIIAIAAAGLAALAQDIKIATGPVDNQVFQRNADQTADIKLSGTAAGKKVNGKDIEARVLGADTSALPGFDWTSIGKIQKLKWSGELKRIPWAAISARSSHAG